MLLLAMTAWTIAEARFVQEVELNDGTVLVGFVYKQQPGRFMVFHVESVRKDAHAAYTEMEKDYTLQWKDVKIIRRSATSDAPWCCDKVTLKNGTVYTGQIEEQKVGVSMTLRRNDTGKTVVIKNSEMELSEKIPSIDNSDIWYDRQYTNGLRLTDNTLHEGLIVLQYRGATADDCYVELLHGTGYRERIYLLDIQEYIFHRN